MQCILLAFVGAWPSSSSYSTFCTSSAVLTNTGTYFAPVTHFKTWSMPTVDYYQFKESRRRNGGPDGALWVHNKIYISSFLKCWRRRTWNSRPKFKDETRTWVKEACSAVGYQRWFVGENWNCPAKAGYGRGSRARSGNRGRVKGKMTPTFSNMTQMAEREEDRLQPEKKHNYCWILNRLVSVIWREAQATMSALTVDMKPPDLY